MLDNLFNRYKSCNDLRPLLASPLHPLVHPSQRKYYKTPTDILASSKELLLLSIATTRVLQAPEISSHILDSLPLCQKKREMHC
jgi:hypothetical protein